MAADVAALRRAYVGAGPLGSACTAFGGSADGVAERRVDEAAFGLRWLEIAHASRFNLKRSLARELPLAWLNDPGRRVGV